MQVIPDIWPVFAWDGGRRVAFAAKGAPIGAVLTLIAHGPDTSACAAVWETDAGVCIAALPDHAMHLDFTIVTPDGERAAIAIELDDQLAPAMVDPTLKGVAATVFDPAARTLSAASAVPSTGFVSLSLNAGGAFGRRMKVGPLTCIERDEAVTDVLLTPLDDRLIVSLDCPAGASPVLAAFIPADATRLAGGPADATGASAETCFARGFRILAAETGALNVPAFGPGDRLVIMAPRHHRIAFGQTERPGTRLTLTGAADGSTTGELATHAYRPATSTALAALSGGALAVGAGAEAESDPIEDAAAIAEAYWKRNRPTAAPSPAMTEAANALTPTAAYPLARLTIASLQMLDAGVTPLMAATGAALKLPPALVEELETLTASDRAAMARWAAVLPETAREACRIQVILPEPENPSADFEVTRLLYAAGDAETSHRMAALADRLAARPASADRRAEIALLRKLGDGHRTGWTPLASLTEALALLDNNPLTPEEAALAAPASRLIKSLKEDQAALAEAQREGQAEAPEKVSERRARIPDTARSAGLPAEAVADVEARLPSLSPAEIILLHKHFSDATQRKDLVQSVKFAILALDGAADSRDLASRMDRSGDPLVGMTRIGSAAGPVMRELVRMPQARDALLALTGWVNAALPTVDPAHALSNQLVRNLKSYGCFLLMNAIAAECRALLAPETESAAALFNRLGSGLSETLPRFAAAVSAKAGDEVKLGLGFIRRLPAVHDGADGKAAS
jgi:hypothetical protein